MLNTLQKHREAKGLSKKRLAALSTVSRPTIIRAERGEFTPSYVNRRLLAAALQVPVDELFPT